MRAITLLCSIAMLVPAAAAAAGSLPTAPPSTEVVAAVVEGSVVRALVVDEPEVIDLQGDDVPARDPAPTAASPAARERRGGSAESSPEHIAGRRSAAAGSDRSGAATQGPDRSRGVVASNTAWRDVGIMFAAGVAGTILFVAGGRRVRSRRLT
jgi:hypothetical protein